MRFIFSALVCAFVWLAPAVAGTLEEDVKQAHSGRAGAQHNLGIIYKQGRGVPQDHTETYLWVVFAAISGDESYVKTRDILGEHLDPASRDQAMEKAKELYAEINNR